MSLSIEEQLLQSRLRFQGEIRAALECKTKGDKIELVQRWRQRYCPDHVQELLNVARNKQVAGDILAWNLTAFRKSK